MSKFMQVDGSPSAFLPLAPFGDAGQRLQQARLGSCAFVEGLETTVDVFGSHDLRCRHRFDGENGDIVESEVGVTGHEVLATDGQRIRMH